MNKKYFTFIMVLSSVFVCLSGCDKMSTLAVVGGKPEESKGGSQAVEPLECAMMNPAARKIVDYEEFTGRMASFDEVEVRAQVSGTLVECTFKRDATMKIDPQNGLPINLSEKTEQAKTDDVKSSEAKTGASASETANAAIQEGGEVKEGRLLFVIDPNLYEAALANAKGALEVLQARQIRLQKDWERAKRLLPDKAISEQTYDLAEFDLKECEAQIAVAKANVQTAQLNLNYSRIYAPIDGYVCNSQVSIGNLVQANSTILVRMVKVNPIYIYLYLDEGTVQNLKRIADERKLRNPDAKGEQTIEFRLSGESEFTRKAVLDYATPALEQSSGTRLVRAICDNPKSPSGERVFQPGMTVHVRITVTELYDALLVPEECLGTNQSERFVYTLGANNLPEMRIVELGPLQNDNMRVIRKGLKPNDWIITNNLMRVRLDRPVKRAE